MFSSHAEVHMLDRSIVMSSYALNVIISATKEIVASLLITTERIASKVTHFTHLMTSSSSDVWSIFSLPLLHAEFLATTGGQMNNRSAVN